MRFYLYTELYTEQLTDTCVLFKRVLILVSAYNYFLPKDKCNVPT